MSDTTTVRVTYADPTRKDQYVTYMTDRLWITEVCDQFGTLIYSANSTACFMAFDPTVYQSAHGIYDPYFYTPV